MQHINFRNLCGRFKVARKARKKQKKKQKVSQQKQTSNEKSVRGFINSLVKEAAKHGKHAIVIEPMKP